MPVKVSCAPGVGAFLAQDQPRPVRPRGEVDHAGGLGHPRPVTELAIGLQCGVPAVLGDGVDDALDPGVHGEPEGELHATLHARDSERVGGAGRVRPGQQPRTRRVSGPRPGLFGQRRQRLVEHGDVVSSGVRASMSRHAVAGADQSVGDTLNQTRVLGHLPQQTDPACDTTPCPSALTTTRRTRLLRFTYGVPST